MAKGFILKFQIPKSLQHHLGAARFAGVLGLLGVAPASSRCLYLHRLEAGATQEALEVIASPETFFHPHTWDFEVKT
jgi:hypothetical protein